MTTTRNVTGNRSLLPCLSLEAALAPQRRKGRVAAEQLQKTYGTSYFAARPLRPSGTSPVPGEARHINSLQASRPACCFFGSRRAAIRSRERALGHGPQGFCLLRCRSPGGRPGIAFRRATAFVPFSGRRESAARRRRGGYVASSASVGHRCPAAMLLRGHSGTGKMRLPYGQAHFSYFILFLRREGTPFNPREPAHRRKSSSPATG